ncbi:hypothetical protein K502DRAFT_346739 [Neoconidiobolus thromboides FSU 785]|nr:hypothetical protein K502DRAFT_346739 [Neoconidiobolus thromboides FSU 785]
MFQEILLNYDHVRLRLVARERIPLTPIGFEAAEIAKDTAIGIEAVASIVVVAVAVMSETALKLRGTIRDIFVNPSRNVKPIVESMNHIGIDTAGSGNKCDQQLDNIAYNNNQARDITIRLTDRATNKGLPVYWVGERANRDDEDDDSERQFPQADFEEGIKGNNPPSAEDSGIPGLRYFIGIVAWLRGNN